MDTMGGILTKGLGGIAENNLIFGLSHLFIEPDPSPTVSVESVGGGPHIRASSKLENTIRTQLNRIDTSDEDEEPSQHRIKKRIVITIALNSKSYDKEFVVIPRTATTKVNVTNVVNVMSTKNQPLITWSDRGPNAKFND